MSNKIKNRVLIAYGESYATVFQNLLSSHTSEAKKELIESGKRALDYFVKAEAFEALTHFASILVSSTRNPQQWQAVIATLQTIRKQLPLGEIHWFIYGILAHALQNNGQSEKAWSLYAQAATEAKAATTLV
jgi:hypothetical protein